MYCLSHTTPSLRFKGWSRKSYAAFYSVGRHVTIGNLKSVVADTFLGKQKNTVSLAEDFLNQQKETTEEDITPPPEEILLKLSGLLPVLFKQNRATEGIDPTFLLELFFAGLMAFFAISLFILT